MTSPKPAKNLDLVEQQYGERPLDKRESQQYEKEYVQNFVEKWDELIDWDGRAKGEGQFFVELLQRRGKHKVLDVATGTGFHSVQLLKAGFEVASVDGSAQMLCKAFENARQHNYILRTTLADWRWLNRDVHEKYDAIICLGNSFTHLFSERDRRRALAEFYAALRHDGILILDQRNYDAILDVGFDSKHTYYYCGETVSAKPDYVDEGLCRFRYDFGDGQTFFLNMFPLRKDYTRTLLKEVGFTEVHTYGDFQQTYREEAPDFFIHVAEKTYHP
jgi:glycine/sarcosine N-methyltransferase